MEGAAANPRIAKDIPDMPLPFPHSILRPAWKGAVQ
jgi:hypothetical protein